MPRPLSLAEHTLLAELVEKSLDAMFDDQFPENGSFITRSYTNREGVSRDYFYYQGYTPKVSDHEPAKRFSRYVGPADDPALIDRVEHFAAIKAGRKERASLVTALSAVGLPKPPVVMGRIIESLAKAGVFRLRAVLVGTAAYQTYPALLGMKLDQAGATTGDVDIAQFRSISLAVEDQSFSIMEALKAADPTFKPLPHRTDPIKVTTFANAAGFRLDILTAHRGSDDQMGKALPMKALTDAAAEPLRFLDYLLYKAVRSVVLYGPGISVNVPAPERFAIHKLIVGSERRTDGPGTAKSRKDLVQAGEIILALHQTGRDASLAEAFTEAWNRGPRWRSSIQKGADRLSIPARSVLEDIAGDMLTPSGSKARRNRPDSTTSKDDPR